MLVSKKTVYVGADIVTMSDKAPKAEAVCIADGRIECVGTREEVLGYAKAGEYDVVDFGGGTLYPGFIDTHSHMASIRCTAALRLVPSPPCSRHCATRPPQAMTNG